MGYDQRIGMNWYLLDHWRRFLDHLFLIYGIFEKRRDKEESNDREFKSLCKAAKYFGVMLKGELVCGWVSVPSVLE